MSEDDVSIATLARSIQRSLNYVAAALQRDDNPLSQLLTSKSILDERTRFVLWAANIGTFHDAAARTSLEHRLRDNVSVLQHIKKTVLDLDTVLKDGQL